MESPTGLVSEESLEDPAWWAFAFLAVGGVAGKRALVLDGDGLAGPVAEEGAVELPGAQLL